MKRIVILCDGTWNEPHSRHPTNVVRLAQMLAPEDPKGVTQIPIYLEGVGTGKGATAPSRFFDKYLGGMFGWGLYDNIIEAYRHLVFLYEPGDQVFIFGFSRGAFTARSLTGFIRSSGIIERDSLFHLPEAVARYQLKNMQDRPWENPEDTHPSSDESHAFRLKISPRMATSPKEITWRKKNGHPSPDLFKVDYLGVLDSVGALGVPAHLSFARLLNRRKYEFHDADLSSMVKSARHAVALDEKRRTFEPTLWSNVSELNAESDLPGTPYLEQYFLGDHGSVGGGGDLTHLSSIALSWMIEGATDAGLAFDPDAVTALSREHDPSGPLRNTTKPPKGPVNLITRLISKDRVGPANTDGLHHSVLTRWALTGQTTDFAPYRPGSLNQLETQIAALLDKNRNGTGTRIA